MRKFLCVLALTLAAGPLFAADITSAWIAQLRLDGYAEISVTRTWLGRMRIIAEKGDIRREIILNPKTGEILRDYSRNEQGRLRLPLGFAVELDDDGHDGPGEAGGEDSEDSEDGGEEDEKDEKDEKDDEGEDE